MKSATRSSKGRVGFWRSLDEPTLPIPEPHSEPETLKGQILLSFATVESEAAADEIVQYRGWSTCRVCGCHNGSRELHVEGWIWPSGLSHYVRVHNVWLPREFKEFLLEKAKQINQGERDA